MLLGFPLDGHRNVVNHLPLLQLLFTLLPKIQFVCPGPRRLPIFAEGVCKLDPMLRDPLHEQVLKFCFPFRNISRCSHGTSRATSNKWPLSRLHLDLRIHSSNNARDVVLLLDLLQALVKLLQRLVVFLQVCLTSPSVWQVHREKEDTNKNNKYPSCASATLSQKVRILFLTAIAVFPSFSRVHPSSSAVASLANFGSPETSLHWLDIEPCHAKKVILC